MFPVDTHPVALPEDVDPNSLPKSAAYIGTDHRFVRLSPDGPDLQANTCPNTDLIWVQNGDQPTLLVWG